MEEKDFNPDYTQAPSEFKEDPEYYVIFATNGLIMGRMIAPSKSKYCQEHQGDLVIFNANVLTKTHGKIWYGDVNVTVDFDNLKNIADQIGEDLYILMEGDARFGKEKFNVDALISKARTVIKCNKNPKRKKKLSNGNGDKLNKLKNKKPPKTKK